MGVSDKIIHEPENLLAFSSDADASLSILCRSFSLSSACLRILSSSSLYNRATSGKGSNCYRSQKPR